MGVFLSALPQFAYAGRDDQSQEAAFRSAGLPAGVVRREYARRAGAARGLGKEESQVTTTVTFHLPGRVVYDMYFNGGPLPPGVHPPNALGTPVAISCTEAQARAMAAWLRDESPEYWASVEVIRLTLDQLRKEPTA